MKLSTEVKRRTKLVGILLLFVSLSILLPSPLALAAGLGVSPGKLNIELSAESSSSTTLNISNIGDSRARYRVYVKEEECKNWFGIEPGEFILSPNECKAVEIMIKPLSSGIAQHQAHICVVSLSLEPSDGRVGVGAGIIVPVNVKVLRTSGHLLPDCDTQCL